MPTLEQITQTGMLSVDRSRNVHPEMASLNEQLVAQEFAVKINSGRLSVKDAYVNFWSYTEDHEMWGLPDDKDWRGILPDWKPLIKTIFYFLDDKHKSNLVDILTENFYMADNRKIKSKFRDKELYMYNPFFSDIVFAADLLASCESENIPYCKKSMDLISSELERWDNVGGQDYRNILLVLWRLCRGDVKTFLSHIPHPAYDQIALAATGDEKALDFLIDRVMNHDDTGKCFQIVAIGEIGTKKACDFLMSYSRNIGNKDRTYAYDGLARSNNKEAIRFLIESARHVEDENHDFIMQALLNSNNHLARLKYIEIMLNNPHVYQGFHTKGQIGEQEFIGSLISNIVSPDNPGKQYSMIALGILRASESAKYIGEYLENRENDYLEFRPDVAREGRKWAVWALGEIGGQYARRVLLHELKEIRMDCGWVMNAMSKTINIQTIQDLYDSFTDRDLVGIRQSYVYSIMQNAHFTLNTTYDKQIASRCLHLLLNHLVDSENLEQTSTYSAIYRIHQILKPRGYNPQQRRLAA